MFQPPQEERVKLPNVWGRHEGLERGYWDFFLMPMREECRQLYESSIWTLWLGVQYQKYLLL
ncbi:hypothetical protein V130003_01420 [Vibrio cholerae]|nr:hypothetical protein V130003_01420 [Vibrio cholerae]